MWRPVMATALLLCASGCCASGEENPYFISNNFRNILHWNKVDSPKEVVRYDVEYFRYGMGEKFLPKAACQNITSLYCDLSAETVYDYHISYYLARVYANGNLLGKTEPFRPLLHTVLGPPTLEVTPSASSLHVIVSLPLGPDNRTSVEDVFPKPVFRLSVPLTLYILELTHPNWEEQQVYESTTGEFVVSHLKRDVPEYCGSVVYRPYRELHHPASEKAAFCVILPDDHGQLLPWFLTFACLLLASVVVTTVFICRYVRAKVSLPDSMIFSIMDTSPMLLHLQEDNISKAKPEEFPYSPYMDQQSQRQSESQFNASRQSPPPESSNNSSRSTLYSVVVVQVPNESAGEGQPNAQSDRDVSDQGRDAGRNTLVLHPQRGPNGVLQLPGHLLEPDTPSSTGCLTPPTGQEESPLLPNLATTGEGAPLLSDLFNIGDSEWLSPVPGAEEETIYISNEVVKTRQDTPFHCPPLPVCSSTELPSEYKQNWLPGTTPKLTLQERDEPATPQWERTKLRWEEEEDEEEEERSPDIEMFLGSWAVQIQG